MVNFIIIDGDLINIAHIIKIQKYNIEGDESPYVIEVLLIGACLVNEHFRDEISREARFAEIKAICNPSI